MADEDTSIYDVTVDDGHYRFVYRASGRAEAYRHGERWPVFEETMLGSKAILSLVAEVDALKNKQREAAVLIDSVERAIDRLKRRLNNG